MHPDEILARLDEAEVVLGSDEAGYGAYAGPLVVGVVLAPKDWVATVKITDSKRMSASARVMASKALLEDTRIFTQILWAHSTQIDAENVYHSNIRMHTQGVAIGLEQAAIRFPGKKVVAVVDGNLVIPGAYSLPKADFRVPVCSAASILAKVARDTWMIEKAVEFPGYGFESSVGYGVPEHEAALEKLGPCAIHRKSFDPIRRRLRNDEPNVLDLIAELDDGDSV